MPIPATELPSYLRLPPAATCAGCGRSALAECRDDMQQHNHYLCTLCTEKGATTTPRDVGTTAGQAIGRMFYAAQDLLIELLEAVAQVKEGGPEAVTALAETLAAPAPPEEDPLGPRPLLTVAHLDGLAGLVDELRYQVDLLEPDPEPRAVLTLVEQR